MLLACDTWRANNYELGMKSRQRCWLQCDTHQCAHEVGRAPTRLLQTDRMEPRPSIHFDMLQEQAAGCAGWDLEADICGTEIWPLCMARGIATIHPKCHPCRTSDDEFKNARWGRLSPLHF